jgi:hypothetical protein
LVILKIKRMKSQKVRRSTKGIMKPKASRNSNFISPALQRKCEKCEEEDKQKVQKKADTHAAGVPSHTGHFISGLSSKGSALSAAQQQFFAKRMAHDFSNVLIHTGPDADASAREMNALAYTSGHHIVFKQGMFNPETEDGKWLLAHELQHVVQQQQGLYRKEADPTAEKEERPSEPPYQIYGPIKEENTTHYGNCEGVSVQGVTNANYSHSHSATINPQAGTGCSGCETANCITSAGTITSTFGANPTVSLPPVPSGLNECETNAVRTFINTTLRAHEQQHVAAFNTYRGTVSTPYSYTGCRDGVNAYIDSIHAGIESARRAASDAASAALDPFNVPIPCNCPDPETEAAAPENE